MNTSALKVYASFASDGTIDYKASAEKLIKDLQEYEVVLDATSEKVKVAVLAVFENFKDSHLNMPALQHYVLKELNAIPENYVVYQNALKAFVRANQGTRESGALIRVRKGPNGGCALWTNLPATITE